MKKKYTVQLHICRTVISLVETEVRANSKADAELKAKENIENEEYNTLMDREEYDESYRIHLVKEGEDR